MICLNLATTNPYVNLATEEYLLKNFSEDVLMLWQSSPSVVVGKHQNMLAEVNFPFITEQQLPAIRRLSGGGTVVHDPGNINFTYIATGKEGYVVDFKRFTQPIVDFLNDRGIPAVLSGRNDILVDGLKFSGNAEHVFKKRVLHHGTILYSSDLEQLRSAIEPTGNSYSDKSVKSNRSSVTNLNRYFPAGYNVEEFKSELFRFLLKRHGSAESTLSQNDLRQIQVLVDEKYSTWEWNFGYSPDYVFTSMGGDGKKVVLSVQKGVIVEAYFQQTDKKNEVAILRNLTHLHHDDFKAIQSVIRENYNFIANNASTLKDLIY